MRQAFVNVVTNASQAMAERERQPRRLPAGRRVPVERGKLIAEVEHWDNPLQAYLLQQYTS
jgi:nitrogen-specific signal transduction histidine kinase